MQQPTFISLYNTLDEAMYYRNSPFMDIYCFEGVQLLPTTTYRYIQRTYAPDGIELEINDAVLRDICGNALAFIPVECFEIIQTFNDYLTGLPQVDWSFMPITDLDFGLQPVYIEFRQAAGSIFSTPFYLTQDNAEYTTRIDYRNNVDDTMLSTQLFIWFRQKKSDLTLVNYKQIGSGKETNRVSQISKYERWQTGVIDIEVFERFKEIFRNQYVYVDLQATDLKEAPETPDTEGRENFIESEVLLLRDPFDVYDPNYVPPIPPDPPLPVYEIILSSVESLNQNVVQYAHEQVGFNPDILQFQWSIDGVTWSDTMSVSNTSFPENIVGVPDHINAGFYYSVYDPVTGTRSNVLQLEPFVINLTQLQTQDAKFNGSPVNITVYFNANFTPAPGTGFNIQYFDSGTGSWQNRYFGAATSPQVIQTYATSGDNNVFQVRVVYDPYGLVSNTLSLTVPLT